MKLPFTAVAILPSAKPRLAHSSPRVAASLAKRSPLSSTFKKAFRVDGAGLKIALNKRGEGRRKKKAVPVEAVDVDIAFEAMILGRLSGKAGLALAPCRTISASAKAGSSA